MFFLGMLEPRWPSMSKPNFDHHANFSQYKTYSWQEIKPANSLWDAPYQKCCGCTVNAKGWTQVASGGEVSVVAIKTTQTERTLQTFYDGFGGGWRWRGFGGMGQATTTEQDYKEGTLVVTFTTQTPSS